MLFTNFNPMAKKAKHSVIPAEPLINVDPTLPSFEGHPYFEKKAAKAKARLGKVGLPKQLSKRSRP